MRTPEQDKFAYALAQDWVNSVREIAATIDRNLDWTHLYYADRSQDPLMNYGSENVRFMKDVPAKYDPGQFFQALCSGVSRFRM